MLTWIEVLWSLWWGKLMMAAVVLWIIVAATAWPATFTEETIQVERMWEKSVGDSGQKYLVSTPEEVYQITDVLLIGHFRASDVYADIREDETYCVRVSGWRIPILSQYRNISEVHANRACS